MTEQVSDTVLADLSATRTILQDGDEEARLDAVRRLAKEPQAAADRKAVLELLIDIMGDDNWQVRKEAVESALAFTDRALLAEHLVLAMSEPDNIGRRNAVIDGVMRLGPITIDPLLRELKQKPEHRKVLVDVLGTFGETRVIPALGESLLDDDPNVRAAAMEQLASFQSDEVVPALVAALGSPDLLVVLAALDGLNRQKTRLPVATFAPMLEQTVLRPAVMTALGLTADVAAVPHLVAGLVEKARGAREAALVALYRLHESLDAAGQRAIVEACQKLDEMAVRSSLRALMEATPPVRQATAALIGWTSRKEMVRPLLLALGDSDAGVAEATAQAFLGMRFDGGETGVTALCELLPTLDPRSRGTVLRFFVKHEAAVRAALSADRLTQLGHQVEAGLGDKNPQTAAAAASALGAFGSAEQLTRLRGTDAPAGAGADLLSQALRRLSERHEGKAG